jgi:DNA (cytosine-5)-methyltransferase 1
MKILSLFSGIGAFEKALDNLRVEYELVNYCEIDKYASKSYAAIHNVSEDKNLGDITKVNEKELPKDIDLITYGFPCQDISLAGKQKGLFNEDGTQTRSGLFFEALRIIEETQPRVAIAENVKNLVGKKFKPQFEIVLESLDKAGYNNYWQVLNAKDYGIPQNRERVFIVSIRKDIDNGKFKFPEGFELKLRLKDMLEDEVDEKYYISNEKSEDLLTRLGVNEGSLIGGMQKHQSVKNDGISTTLTSSMGTGGGYVPMFVEPKRLGGLFDTEKSKHQAGSIWDKECISPTIDTMQGGYRQPCVIVKEATKKGYAEAVEGDSINFEQPNSKTRRGRVGKQVAQTLTTSPQQGVVVNE